MLWIKLYEAIKIKDYLLFFLVVCQSHANIQGSNKLIRSGASIAKEFISLYHFQLFQYEDYHHTHEKVQQSTETRNDEGIHHSSTYYLLKFDNDTYKIDLELNHNLLSEDFTIVLSNEAGERRLHKPNANQRKHCYYQGYVRGMNNARVVASTCHGLRASVTLPDDFFFIEPLRNGSYVIYHSNDATENLQYQFCLKNSSAYDNTYFHSNSVVKRSIEMVDELVQQRPIKQKYAEANKDRNYVELMVIVSYEVYKKFSNISKVESFVKETVNYVDSFYQALNINVILTQIEVWNKGNEVNMTTADQFLLDIGSYRIRQIHLQPPSSPWRQADAIQLIFTEAFENGVFGNAYTNTMCTTKALGLTRLNKYAMNTASTMAHEIGHNFGLVHDSENCVCNAVECFMAARTRFRHPLQWSSCSQEALQHCFEVGLGNCLYNKPKIIFGGPICGNNIVEPGEQCDCGFPKHCRSKCCNASSCQLISGAMCDDSLLCCNDCQIVTNGLQCRQIANECDLPEFCDGTSPECPSNAYKEDGSRCLDDKASCKEGVCLTVDLLCESMWGKGSKGPGYCYEKLNVLGEYIGNCGRDASGKYISCSSQDVLCGKLFCDGDQKEPVVGDYAEITTTHIGYHICKSYVLETSNLNDFELGLVPNGTSCGRGKACQNRICQNISPSLCNKECNGNGICDNFGVCHCNNGWKSPYCNETENFTTPQNLHINIDTGFVVDKSFNCSQHCNENELCDEFGKCSCKTGWLPPLCDKPEKQGKVKDWNGEIVNKFYVHSSTRGDFTLKAILAIFAISGLLLCLVLVWSLIYCEFLTVVRLRKLHGKEMSPY